MSKFGIGQPVRRVEDQRLITGQGRFTDDINLPGQAHLYVLRSPTAHARIASLDTSAAKAAPGVLLVATAAELDAGLPCFIPITNRDGTDRADPQASDPVPGRGQSRRRQCRLRRRRDARAGEGRGRADRGRVRRSAGRGRHRRALAPGAAQVHPEAPGNLAFDWHYGDEAAVQAAFAKAARWSSSSWSTTGSICNAMEPRACVAEWDAGEPKLTLQTGTQGVLEATRHAGRRASALDPEQVRVLTPDVGGGFGMKAFFYPEYAMAGYAARALGRPVKWTAERGESFLSDTMGRDHVTTAQVALRRRPPHPGLQGRPDRQHGRLLLRLSRPTSRPARR